LGGWRASRERRTRRPPLPSPSSCAVLLPPRACPPRLGSPRRPAASGPAPQPLPPWSASCRPLASAVAGALPPARCSVGPIGAGARFGSSPPPLPLLLARPPACRLRPSRPGIPSASSCCHLNAPPLLAPSCVPSAHRRSGAGAAEQPERPSSLERPSGRAARR